MNTVYCHQSHNEPTQGDNVLRSGCEVLNRLTFIFHVDDCQQHAIPFGAFSATAGLQSLLKSHFLHSKKMNIRCDTKDVCALHLHETTECPLGALCDELHLSHEFASACGLPKPHYWADEIELPLLIPTTPDSPSYSSASSVQLTPGHSVCFSDDEETTDEWSYVLNSPLTRKRLSRGLHDSPTFEDSKPLQLYTNAVEEEEYSDFSSDECSEYFNSKGWALRPNCRLEADVEEGDDVDDEEDRDTDYSDFDSEDSLLRKATKPIIIPPIPTAGGFGCYNYVEYPEPFYNPHDAEEYFQCFVAARWVSDELPCTPTPAYEQLIQQQQQQDCYADSEADRDTNYSDFDSENSLIWRTTGYAC